MMLPSLVFPISLAPWLQPGAEVQNNAEPFQRFAMLHQSR
jgi:hypothetical protein